MQKKPKKNKLRFERYMLRPLLYQGFTRFFVTLAIVLLWHFFTKELSGSAPLLWGFTAAGGFFLVMAWMAYLRLDGLHMPKFDRRLFHRKKKPIIGSYADMSDFVDEDIVDYDDLDDDEKDVCLLAVDAVLGVVFIVVSFLV